MNDTENHDKVQSQEKGPGKGGEIIDATTRNRPRIHRLGAERRDGGGGLDFLKDVPLKLNVVLAQTTMQLGEVIALEADSIVQLDKPSGDPVDIYIEDQKLGRGEVVVIHEKLRIRILEITPPFMKSEEAGASKTEEE